MGTPVNQKMEIESGLVAVNDVRATWLNAGFDIGFNFHVELLIWLSADPVPTNSVIKDHCL
jgi:hypothetical protein